MGMAIEYYGLGLAIIALFCTVAALLYRSKLQKRARQIGIMPEEQRIRFVERTLKPFKVDTAQYTREDQYGLALRKIRERARLCGKIAITASIVFVVASVATCVIFLNHDQVSSMPPPHLMDMSGEIESVEVVPDRDSVQVFIYLTIRNAGNPTVVNQYNIRLRDANSESLDFNGPPEEIAERYAFTQSGGRKQIIIQPQDSMMSKTQQPVAAGQRVSGWLRLALPLPADVLKQPGIRYTVTFVNARGETYQATYEVR